MLSGIWNNDTYAIVPASTQYDMDNKPYYPGVCRFNKREHEEGMSIGESIRYANQFFSHDNPSGSDKTPDNFWRRHWHNGSRFGGLRTIMNYWDSELTEVYFSDGKSATSNYQYTPLGQLPTKTIYDPCPVGFCVPNANAFSNFAEHTHSTSLNYDTPGLFIKQRKGYGDKVIGWDISKIAESGNSTIFLPATGLRDMGEGSKAPLPEYFKSSTNPAHSKVTFIATTIFNRNDTSYDEENYYEKSSSCLLIYVDDRNSTIHINEPTNNAYGFSIRPIKDTK